MIPAILRRNIVTRFAVTLMVLLCGMRPDVFPVDVCTANSSLISCVCACVCVCVCARARACVRACART